MKANVLSTGAISTTPTARLQCLRSCLRRLLCFFGVLLFLVLPTLVRAQFTFLTNNDDSLTLTAYTSSASEVIIPGSVDGRPISSIGDRAFQLCTNATSVVLPDSVTRIGSGAFSDCYNLTNLVMSSTLQSLGDWAFGQCLSLGSVVLPDSLTNVAGYAFIDCWSLTNLTLPEGITTIGQYAFESCISLPQIAIPSTVTNIGYLAFENCPSLTAITVNAQNPAYSSVEGVLFDKGQSTLIECPGGKVGGFAIPYGVTTFGPRAFYCCANLTSISIPNTVTNIAYCAFEGCANLTSLTIPPSVTSIEEWAFAYCTNLAELYFGGNAPTLKNNAIFYSAPTIVYYLPGTSGWGPTFGGRPAVPWNAMVPSRDGSFGLGPNGFGFTITGETNLPVVVEACTDLANPVWIPLQTNTLTSGSVYFSDPQWTNYPTRLYRLRWP